MCRMSITKPLISTSLAAGLAVVLSACGSSTAPEVTASVPAPVDAPLSAQLVADLQASLDSGRAELGFPGAIAGVWTPEGTWVGTTGTSGPDSTRPPAPDDHTRIGSLTKTFTVMALLQLVDQGKVSLDDTIGQYVADVPNADTATLKDLGAMTSGIPSYSASEAFLIQWGSDPNQVFSPEELIDYVRDSPASFPAGTEVEYSNSNTVLLGMVIEQVTGESMAEVYQRGLLDPLGLKQTSFPGDSAALPQPHLDGVTEQAEPWGELKNATSFNPSWTFTAGGMVSTLEDVRTWTVALGTGGGLISDELQSIREESAQSTVPPNTADLAYALGFFNADGWWGHNGSIPGFTTYAVYNPKSQTSVVVMVNSDIRDDTSPAPADAVALKLIEDLD